MIWAAFGPKKIPVWWESGAAIVHFRGESKMKRILVSLGFVCAFAGSLWAQTATPSSSAAAATPQSVAPVKNPVTTVLRTTLASRQKNMLAAIDAMPAD